MSGKTVEVIVGQLKNGIRVNDTYIDVNSNNELVTANGAATVISPIDCSTNPNYPSSKQGDIIPVSVAGKIGGAAGVDVEVGDAIICINTTVGGTQVAVGTNFIIMQNNIVGAVVNLTGGTDNHVALMDGTTGKVIKDGGVWPYVPSITTYTDSPHTLTNAQHQNYIIGNIATPLLIKTPATPFAGLTYEISNINTGILTVDSNGSGAINGMLTVKLAQYDKIKLFYTGVVWIAQITRQNAMGAIYTKNDAVAVGATAVMNYDDVYSDQFSLVQTGSDWKFTAIESGIYTIKASIILTASLLVINKEMYIDIYKNTTRVLSASSLVQGVATEYWVAAVGGEVPLVATDYIQIKITQNSGSNINTYTDAAENYVSIFKI